nr:MAG TPA: hypothetical protein [Caudoviricetes sp.]
MEARRTKIGSCEKKQNDLPRHANLTLKEEREKESDLVKIT